MDNGSILFALMLAPLLPLIIIAPLVIVFGTGFVVHALIGAVISSAVELSRSRRERAYVRKHQRDMSRL